MPRNGSGTFSAPSNSYNPAVTGVTINSTDWNACLADLAAAITASIANDGQTATTAKMPFAFGIDISAATGGQINFPAAQNASAGANVLDDYEEGTATPTLGDGTNNFTLTTANLRYTKVGNLVFWNTNCTWSSIGSAGAGQLRIGGLPFAAGTQGVGMFYFSQANGLDTAGGANFITAAGAATETAVYFNSNSDNAVAVALAANSCSATGKIVGAGFYFA